MPYNNSYDDARCGLKFSKRISKLSNIEKKPYSHSYRFPKSLPASCWPWPNVCGTVPVKVEQNSLMLQDSRESAESSPESVTNTKQRHVHSSKKFMVIAHHNGESSEKRAERDTTVQPAFTLNERKSITRFQSENRLNQDAYSRIPLTTKKSFPLTLEVLCRNKKRETSISLCKTYMDLSVKEIIIKDKLVQSRNVNFNMDNSRGEEESSGRDTKSKTKGRKLSATTSEEKPGLPTDSQSVAETSSPQEHSALPSIILSPNDIELQSPENELQSVAETSSPQEQNALSSIILSPNDTELQSPENELQSVAETSAQREQNALSSIILSPNDTELQNPENELQSVAETSAQQEHGALSSIILSANDIELQSPENELQEGSLNFSLSSTGSEYTRTDPSITLADDDVLLDFSWSDENFLSYEGAVTFDIDTPSVQDMAPSSPNPEASCDKQVESHHQEPEINTDFPSIPHSSVSHFLEEETEMQNQMNVLNSRPSMPDPAEMITNFFSGGSSSKKAVKPKPSATGKRK